MPKFGWYHAGSSNQTVPFNPLPYQIVNVVKVIQDNLKLVTNDLETKEIKINK